MSRVYVFNEFSQQAKDLSARLMFPLKVGDKILRPVVHYETTTERLGHVIKPRVLTPKFEKNERGQFIIKVQKWQTAEGQWVALDSKRNGIVCFCSFEITPMWTYLEVTSVGTKGKCAFVKPVCGNEEELVACFKRR